jgi:hypothetical protein
MKRMMKKFMFVMIFSVVFLFGFTAFENEASADFYGYYKFATGDGKWDGKVWVRNGGNVRFEIQNYQHNYVGKVSVRLCSAATGNCTSFKNIDGPGSVMFYNMVGGTYLGDIISRESGEVKGRVGFGTY